MCIRDREGESISLILDSDNAAMEQKRITPYPLLVTTEDYYGETKYNQFPAQFNAREDNPGPLMIGAALIRGNAGDVNQNKTTGRLVLLGNKMCIRDRDMRSGMTTRHGFPGREVQGRGFQSSTKLCIIVHDFLTTLYPFSLFSSMECKLCSKSNKPLKPLDLRGFEDGSREVI